MFSNNLSNRSVHFLILQQKYDLVLIHLADSNDGGGQEMPQNVHFHDSWRGSQPSPELVGAVRGLAGGVHLTIPCPTKPMKWVGLDEGVLSKFIKVKLFADLKTDSPVLFGIMH